MSSSLASLWVFREDPSWKGGLEPPKWPKDGHGGPPKPAGVCRDCRLEWGMPAVLGAQEPSSIVQHRAWGGEPGRVQVGHGLEQTRCGQEDRGVRPKEVWFGAEWTQLPLPSGFVHDPGHVEFLQPCNQCLNTCSDPCSLRLERGLFRRRTREGSGQQLCFSMHTGVFAVGK